MHITSLDLDRGTTGGAASIGTIFVSDTAVLLFSSTTAAVVVVWTCTAASFASSSFFVSSC